MGVGGYGGGKVWVGGMYFLGSGGGVGGLWGGGGGNAGSWREYEAGQRLIFLTIASLALPWSTKYVFFLHLHCAV